MKNLSSLIYSALLALLLAATACANPIPGDSGNSLGPIPLRGTSVYLQAEAIVVNFANQAEVQASYTFTNTSIFKKVVPILLPFLSEPGDLQITLDGQPIAYSRVSSPDSVLYSKSFCFQTPWISCDDA